MGKRFGRSPVPDRPVTTERRPTAARIARPRHAPLDPSPSPPARGRSFSSAKQLLIAFLALISDIFVRFSPVPFRTSCWAALTETRVAWSAPPARERLSMTAIDLFVRRLPGAPHEPSSIARAGAFKNSAPLCHIILFWENSIASSRRCAQTTRRRAPSSLVEVGLTVPVPLLLLQQGPPVLPPAIPHTPLVEKREAIKHNEE